ncbi:ATP-binding protein [Frigidibacter oleivorans]|uniref:ATP-binding protein n=1 Tax=Frigidibacter oleivorans TaxID=2487129 RepID=UPI000F8F3565|nr:ATP-binding protein [Frigidibacter oleivorans]
MLELLAKERRARLAAERLLDQKSRELIEANRRLALHARSLSDQIVAQRTEAEGLKTGQSRAMAEAERAHWQALRAERRLWQALDSIDDGFALFDRGLRLVLANPVWARLWTGAEVLDPGTGYDAMLAAARAGGRLPPDLAPDWVARMRARLEDDTPAPVTVALADGRLIRLTERRGPEGDLACLARDVTDITRHQRDLEDARARAEAASRAKSAFLANMSHEIRTPMNGVVGMADLLCAGPLTEEQRLCAETIRSSGEALLAIINDVLDFSRIEADRMTLAPAPFDLERCIHEVMLLLGPSARDRGLSLMVDFDLFLPTRFVGDALRIRQVLTNLAGNAVKFTAAGHVLVRVTGIEQADSGTFDLHVTVEDTGIGIAAADVERIFDEFEQVEAAASRSFEGTGLGLAITRRLIALMGGEVWVDSVPGEGSCFGFRLSLPAAEPREERRQPALARPLARALVIDAQLLDRTILGRQLATFGIAPVLCADPEAAHALRQAAGAAPVDLVIADLAALPAEAAAMTATLARIASGLPVFLMAPPGQPLPEAIAAADPASAPAIAAMLPRPVLRSDLWRALSALAPAEAPAPATPPAEPSTPRRMRVLAAEDNRTNQLVFAKMVAGLAIDLAFAGDGLAALDRWRDWRPDLIFMDVSMPRMDGVAAARAIRAAEAAQGGHVPIVALTAHALDGDAEAILAAGMDRYMTKPLRRAAIVEAILAHAPDGAVPPLSAAPQAEPLAPDALLPPPAADENIPG